MTEKELQSTRIRINLLQRVKKKQGLTSEQMIALKGYYREIELHFAQAFTKGDPKVIAKSPRKRFIVPAQPVINKAALFKIIENIPATFIYIAQKLKVSPREVHEYFNKNKDARRTLTQTRHRVFNEGKKMCSQCLEVVPLEAFESKTSPSCKNCYKKDTAGQAETAAALVVETPGRKALSIAQSIQKEISRFRMEKRRT